MGPGYGSVKDIFTECGGEEVLENMTCHSHEEVSAVANQIRDRFDILVEANHEMHENNGMPSYDINKFLI